MIFLVLTILCSTSIALMIKHNDVNNGNPVVLLAGNYLIASFISLIFIIADRETAFSWQTLIFGMFLAFMFVGSFFMFTRSVRVAGTALATVSARLSVVIPFVLSVIWYHEKPNWRQGIGFVLAFLTIIFFYYSLKSTKTERLQLTHCFYLLALLVGVGLSDFSIKVFQQWRPLPEKPFFLWSIFTFSFIYTTGLILSRRLSFEPVVFIRGGILGIPNLFSSFFLLNALAKLPAILVYPVTNIGIILLTTMAAALTWHEKPNVFGKWALVFGLVSIVLLGL